MNNFDQKTLIANLIKSYASDFLNAQMMMLIQLYLATNIFV